MNLLLKHPIQYLAELLRQGLAWGWRRFQGVLSREQGLQGDTQAIDVGLCRRLGGAVLLRSGIAGRAKRAGILVLARAKVASNAEVDEVQVPFVVDSTLPIITKPVNQTAECGVVSILQRSLRLQ